MKKSFITSYKAGAKLLLIIFCYFLSVYSIDANWYGPKGPYEKGDQTNVFTQKYPSSSSFWGWGRAKTSWCEIDKDETGGSPEFYNDTYDSKVVGRSGGSRGSMYCVRWDGSKPVITKIEPEVKGWTNKKNISITVKTEDKGGSKLNESSLTVPKTHTGTHGEFFTASGVIYDNAGNKSDFKSGALVKFDYIEPLITKQAQTSSGWTNQKKVFIKVGIIEENSGLKDVEMSGTTESFFTKDATGTGLTATGYIKKQGIERESGDKYIPLVKVIDNAGNESKTRTGGLVQFDFTKPVITSLTTIPSSGWTNKETVNITLKVTEEHSGVKKVEMPGTDTGTGKYISALKYAIGKKTGKDGEFYKPCATVYDNAGNESDETCKEVIKFDFTKPKMSDLTTTNSFHQGEELYLLANDKQELTFKVSRAGGSPIKSIEGKIDGKDVNFILYNSDSDYDYFKISNLDFSKVDFKREEHNNYRVYSLSISKICDKAGNCNLSNDVKKIDYKVLANDIDLQKSKSSTKDFNSDNNFADGKEREIEIQLLDKYDNKIDPVYKADGKKIIRDITFNLKYDNSVYLDQYKNSGKSGIYYTDFNGSTFKENELGNGRTINNTIKKNNTGIYTIKYKVYSPTSNSSKYIRPGEKYNINQILVQLSDITGAGNMKHIMENLDFQFKPQYETYFEGSIIKNGLILGTQESQLKLGKKDSTSGKVVLYLEYGYKDDNKHKEHLKLELFYNNKKISGPNANVSDLTNFGYFQTSGEYDFNTNLVQNSTLTKKEQNTYIATHLKVKFGDKNSVYSSYTYGLENNNYYNGVSGYNTHQRGLKIIGSTHSNKYTEIIKGQSEKDLHLIGNIDKSILQAKIRENVYNFTRNIKTKSTYDNDINNFIDDYGDGVKIGNVIYYGNLNGKRVTLGEQPNDKNVGTIKYNGNSTIVIVGGDLYISENIKAKDKSKDVLGIIVMKDNNGKGGNIIIDPGILEIDAVMYADKSLVSGYASDKDNNFKLLDYDKLNKKLHIYGSVFSNNTIGGSVGDSKSFKCPYYITDCNREKSQIYDLNYLRRVTKGYSVIIEYNPLIQSKIPKLFEN